MPESGRAQVDSRIREHALEVVRIVFQATQANPILVADGGTPAQEWERVGPNGKAQPRVAALDHVADHLPNERGRRLTLLGIGEEGTDPPAVGVDRVLVILG